MITYLGCETAREMLEAFVDDELSTTDQVAVESHLRWCNTCAARVEDVRLIGSGLKIGPPAQEAAVIDAPALRAMQSGVLMRIRTEHDLSLIVRVRDLFDDMRLFWPALGATTAVMICLLGAYGVLNLTTREQPDSLAAMIDSLADPDRYPVRLDSAMSIPRGLDNSFVLDSIGGGSDAVFAVATVVTREGRISGYELLDNHASFGDTEALLHAVKQSRFEPAQAPGGRTVAVNMVWLFAWTTVERDGQLEELLKGSARNNRVRVDVPATPVLAPPPVEEAPAPVTEDVPPGRRSSRVSASTTA
jgi:hypothetical protein